MKDEIYSGGHLDDAREIIENSSANDVLLCWFCRQFYRFYPIANAVRSQYKMYKISTTCGRIVQWQTA